MPIPFPSRLHSLSQVSSADVCYLRWKRKTVSSGSATDRHVGVVDGVWRGFRGAKGGQDRNKTVKGLNRFEENTRSRQPTKFQVDFGGVGAANYGQVGQWSVISDDESGALKCF